MTSTEPSARTQTPTGVGLGEKLRRHYRWIRDEGLARVVEEDRLDPVDRIRTAAAKAAWRRRHGVERGTAMPVFVVGLQRSGTNMLLRGLDAAGEVEVRNENDRTLFEKFHLREDDVLRRVVGASRHQVVLVKPLIDSHRTPHLLDVCGTPGRAIWAYREVDGRVRSSVSKFGASNLQALVRIAEGGGAGMWQAGGLGEADLALLRELDVASMDPASASALFWYLRNKLFFELGLDADPRVVPVSYDGFLRDPEGTMRRVVEPLGIPYRAGLVAGVEPTRSAARPPLDLHPEVRALCTVMQEKLDAASGAAP